MGEYEEDSITNTCSIVHQEKRAECLEEVTPLACADPMVSGQTPECRATDTVYQVPEKTCKGPCGRMLPGTPEYFQRCRKYKRDGLDSRCKECARQRRRDRARFAGIRVVPPIRYRVGSDGQLLCLKCNGYVYDSGIDGELYCLSCGMYINPPPQPVSFASDLLGGN